MGPSPRFTLSKSLPFHRQDDGQLHSDDSENEAEEVSGCPQDDEDNTNNGVAKAVKLKNSEEQEVIKKIGPGDFEIMRVIGKGAFGKVFQVRMKQHYQDVLSSDDGIFAMKVMRKDTIIKNNHVDYMKAERDILTKVVHPFIVQLRYSFQVLFWRSYSIALPAFAFHLTFFFSRLASSLSYY